MANMADLLKAVIEGQALAGHSSSGRKRKPSISDSASESEEEARPRKRPQADDDTLSICTTNGDIQDLIEGTSSGMKDTQHGTESTEDKDAEAFFLKSLEADLNEDEAVGLKINDQIANIAKKRWGITLSSETKNLLAKHDKPENCSEMTVPKVFRRLTALKVATRIRFINSKRSGENYAKE
ncbi:hypothetical protein QZH41_001757 [Actinostola sp. cb2023]|nr:hypothetical protein QZH41_001757 [Actinostola sp. cb2023]